MITLRLYIDSGTHVDTALQKRIRDIEDALEEPQIVFYEGDTSAFNREALRSVFTLFLYTPLIAIASVIQIYIFIELFGRILSVIGGESAGTDQEIVETLKRKYSIESREVDQGFTWYVLDHSLTFAIINWSILGGLLAITWPIPLTAVKVAQLSLHAALVGYILLLPVLALVHLSRNKYSVDKISESKDAYENACLVAGEAHHAEVGTILESTSGITVMNPDPEDPSLTTRVAVAFISSVRKITNHF